MLWVDFLPSLGDWYSLIGEIFGPRQDFYDRSYRVHPIRYFSLDIIVAGINWWNLKRMYPGGYSVFYFYLSFPPLGVSRMNERNIDIIRSRWSEILELCVCVFFYSFYLKQIYFMYENSLGHFHVFIFPFSRSKTIRRILCFDRIHEHTLKNPCLFQISGWTSKRLIFDKP